MDGGDIESGGSMTVAEAEPDDCGRIRVIVAVGLVMLSIIGFSIYLIGPEEFHDDPPKPDNMFVFVAGIVCFIIGCCFFVLFGSLLHEAKPGYEVHRRRLVDMLLM
jgi:hypothetical protein